MNLTPSAIDLIKKKYCNNNETPEDVFDRVGNAISSVMNGDDDAKLFTKIMKDLDFLPNSPCIRNAGLSNQVKACVSGDTLIYTKDGLVPMSDIKIGDYVLTHMGRYRPVTNIWSNGKKDTIKVCNGKKGRLTHTCELTQDHKILNENNEWIESISINKPMNVIPPTDMIPTKIGNVDNDKELAWLIGFYLAEGDIYLNNKKGNNPKKVVRFTNGNQTLMEKLKSVLNNKNIDCGSICDSNFGKWKNLRIYNHVLAEDLEKEFGKGFNLKRLPDWVYSASTEYRENLLLGILDGDGQKRYSTSRRIDLANQTLIFQLKLLAESLKYHTSIVFNTYQYGQTKPTARLIMNKTQPNKYQIVGTSHSEVFDMEVKEDHSFIAGEFIVHNCFVLPIEDSMDSIFTTMRNSAMIFKGGGGVGYNFSDLREKGAKLSHGGTSSGVMSFMRNYNSITESVKQGGFRRGASMGVMDIDHPEILDFIKEKLTRNTMNNFNLSVMATDEFMKGVETDGKVYLRSRIDKRVIKGKFKCRDLFNIICYSAWLTGDPGLLFYDRINEDNPFKNKFPIRATNPCITGDTLIAVADGRNAVSIGQLAKEGKDVPVYSRNKETGQVEIKMGRKPRITKIGADTVILEFHDSSCVEVTPNHRIMMKDKTFKEVKDINIGDSLMPFDSFKSNGYRQIVESGKKMTGGRHRNRRQYRLISEFNIGKFNYKNMHIHHIDYDKTNDSPNNLVVMEKDKHIELHTKNMLGDKNPYHRMSDEWKFRFASHKGKDNPKYNNVDNTKLIEHGKTLFNKKNKITKKLWIEYAKNNNLPQNIWTTFRFGSWNNFKNKVIGNHIVTGIHKDSNKVVYNMTVDDNHTYCIITKGNDDRYINSSGITVHNCGEVPLLPYESCCLGSINLSNFVTEDGEFDTERFRDIVRISTKFLMGMNKICEFSIDECYIAQAKYLRVGLGVMGFADMLMKMGIMYDSEDTLKIIDTIGEIMQESKKYAPQSVATLSIAPTGSLSIIANCSSGIEPWFSKSYTRHLTHGTVNESRDSEFLRTAHDISPEWHLKIQARWQSYIDNGVSKTINLPANATINDIQNIYMDAWKMGCKGITIFRDGCLGDSGQVLRSTCDDEDCYL
jgi:ribonucleotide reductase alpha subunit